MVADNMPREPQLFEADFRVCLVAVLILNTRTY